VVTLGEAIVWGTAIFLLWDYWMMLPVWPRVLAALFLAALSALALYRLIKFWTRPQSQRSDLSPH
jgi:hypothetical protein